MYEDEIKFLNNNDITVLKEYFKQWGSKKLEYLIVEEMKRCGLKYKSSTSYNKNAKKNNVSYEYYLANRMYQQ